MGHPQKTIKFVASFPGSTHTFLYGKQYMESWAGPGNEASKFAHPLKNSFNLLH